MKNYPLFIALCASCAVAGGAVMAEEISPKIVRVGDEKAAAQTLDAQAEQQPLRAKIDKRDLFDYLDKNYGSTQKKAESQPVQAEELPKPQASAAKLVESAVEKPKQEKPWDVKVAEPVNDKQAAQMIQPKQEKLEPIKLVKPQAVSENKQTQEPQSQAKTFVLRGFEQGEAAAKPAVEAKAESKPAVQPAPQKEVDLGRLNPAGGKNARWLNEPKEQEKPAAAPEPKQPEQKQVATDEPKQIATEQKRYPLLNREMLEKKQEAPAPLPQAPVQAPVEAKVQAAPQDRIVLVERKAAPEVGDEKATTRALNMQMLEAPSAAHNNQRVKPAAKEAVHVEKSEPQPAKPRKQREEVAAGEKVVRSSFTSRVNGLEPADSLSTAKPNARKLYYFTEVAGMTGRRVTHRWEQNGKVLVEKSMTVGSNKWRLWSSATPKSGSNGDVSVSVLDDGGNVLKTENLGISN